MTSKRIRKRREKARALAISNHVHTWAYEAKGTRIYATCITCGTKE